MANRKTGIGILGLGSRSTLFYIEQLNNKYQLLRGGENTCPFILLNTDFNTINPYLPDDFETLQKNLLPYLEAIQNLNIAALLVPNITLHETLDLLMQQHNFKFSIISPFTKTLELLRQSEENEVLLIASLHSMQSTYITSQLLKSNITVSLPNQTEMKFIDNFRQNIYLNKESAEDISQYQQLVKTFAATNAVVIACTELSLAYSETNTLVYDMARIQIDETLNRIFSMK